MYIALWVSPYLSNSACSKSASIGSCRFLLLFLDVNLLAPSNAILTNGWFVGGSRPRLISKRSVSMRPFFETDTTKL